MHRRRSPALATWHRNAPALRPLLPLDVPRIRSCRRQLWVLAYRRGGETDGCVGGAEAETIGEEGQEGECEVGHAESVVGGESDGYALRGGEESFGNEAEKRVGEVMDV